MAKTIKIKYFNNDIEKISKIDNGDWIDLRSATDIDMYPGDFKLIPLNVAMQLPEGYEAHVAPRSSTFKNFGIIQTNSVGVIDESYCGDNDQWFMPAFCLAARHGNKTSIKKGDRVCQFRIMKKQPKIEFVEVDKLGNEDRGGHGSTGVK